MKIPAPSRAQSERRANDALARVGLQPIGQQALCPADQEMQHNTSIIVTYLLDQVPQFRRLAELRRKVN
jgi:ribosome biogenesis protein Tsr3